MIRLRKAAIKLKKKVGIDRLEKREKLVLSGGLIFVVLFIIFQAGIMPFLEARSNLERSLARKQEELLDMKILAKEYQSLKEKQGSIEQRLKLRSAQFSLFSFLEQQAAEARVKELITSMKPSQNEIDEGFLESIVEMKISRLTLDQLVDFLKRIESDKNVVIIRRLSVTQSSEQQGLLEAVLRVVTFSTPKTVIKPDSINS